MTYYINFSQTTTSPHHTTQKVIVEVISATEEHVKLLKTIFDFPALKALVARKDFSLCYDCMHGVQGPYAHEVRSVMVML